MAFELLIEELMIIIGIIIHCIVFLFFFHLLVSFSDSKLLISLRALIPNSKAGNKLYQQTITFSSSQLNKSNQFELIQYKYFTALINELIESARRYGTNIHSYLPGIKEGLIKDIQLDKKVFGLFLGGVYQFVLVFILGFVFVTTMMAQLDSNISFLELLVPVSLQLIGLITYCSFYIFLRKIRFSELFKYLFKLYQIRTLSQAQLPLKEVFSRVAPDELSEKGDLKFFKEKIILLFKEMKNKGAIDTADLDININELWQYIELRFEKFNKELAAIKLTHLAIFSLGGYLVLLLQVFSKISF
tara:strand:+ start:368 stop:1273 length:906 start_codon:yes stop_codon:yes gene_type:complete